MGAHTAPVDSQGAASSLAGAASVRSPNLLGGKEWPQVHRHPPCPQLLPQLSGQLVTRAQASIALRPVGHAGSEELQEGEPSVPCGQSGQTGGRPEPQAQPQCGQQLPGSREAWEPLRPGRGQLAQHRTNTSGQPWGSAL